MELDFDWIPIPPRYIEDPITFIRCLSCKNDFPHWSIKFIKDICEKTEKPHCWHCHIYHYQGIIIKGDIHRNRRRLELLE